MSRQPAPASGALPAGDPVVMHVWVAAGHSLCELEHGDYLQDHLAELKAPDAPVCGPCLLILSRLRRQAAALLELAHGTVAPESPTQAWRLLAKSPWGKRLDIGTFLRGTPDLDERTRFDAISYAVEPDSVHDLAAEMRDARSNL